jgi:hypothetical protein
MPRLLLMTTSNTKPIDCVCLPCKILHDTMKIGRFGDHGSRLQTFLTLIPLQMNWFKLQ